MKDCTKTCDISIILYDKRDYDAFRVVLNALKRTQYMNQWDIVQGKEINQDPKIPSMYHKDGYAIICLRTNGTGEYHLTVSPYKKNH